MTMPEQLGVLNCFGFLYINTLARAPEGVLIIGPCITTWHLIIELIVYASLQVKNVGKNG